MSSLNNFLFILVLMTTFACGRGTGKKTQAAMVISGNAFAGNAATELDGGLMIYGFGPGGSFAIEYKDGKTITLDNGNWNFAAIGWKTKAMNGAADTTKCAISENISLAGGEISINLSFKIENCAHPFFGPGFAKEATGEPAKIDLETCVDEKAEDYSSNSCYRGNAQSFQVSLPTKSYRGSWEMGTGVKSSCYNHALPSAARVSSDIRMPLFMDVLGGVVPVRIETFTNTSCVGDTEQFDFTRGALAGISNRASFSPEGTGIAFTLNGDICSQPIALTSSPFAFSSGTSSSDHHVICTADQLAAVNLQLPSGSFAMQTYILGSDIDLSLTPWADANMIGSGTIFQGKFYGLNHTISNLSISTAGNSGAGFFFEADGSDCEIQDIIFSSPSMIVSASNAASPMGFLAAKVGVTSSAGCSIRNIHLKNSPTMTIDTSTTSIDLVGIGGLVGVMGDTSNNTVEMSSINGLVMNLSNVVATKIKNIGGLVGEMTDGGLRNNTLINLDMNITNNDSSSDSRNFGGLLGSLVSGEVEGNIASVDIDASNIFSVGGLVGEARGGVRNSKSTGEITITGMNGNAGDSAGIGGAIGVAFNAYSIENVLSSVDLTTPTATNLGNSVGGLIGSLTNASAVRGLRASGDILACNSKCGGLIGHHTGTASGVNSFWLASGNVTASGDDIGGLIGYSDATGGVTLNFAISSGDVSGVNNIGGLIGRHAQVAFKVKNAITYGQTSVTGTSGGGLIGYVDDTMSIDDYRNVVAGGLVVNGMGAFGGGSLSNQTSCRFTSLSDGNCNSGTSISLSDFGEPAFDGTSDDFWIEGDGTNRAKLRIHNKYETLGLTTLGSIDDPFLIGSSAQWNIVGDDPRLMGAVFKIANNINFSSGAFNPWGSSLNPFHGWLNGNGMTLSNIYKDESGSGTDHLGLIRSIGTVKQWDMGATIAEKNKWDWGSGKSLTLENIVLKAGGGYNVGALTGYLNEGTSDMSASKIQNIFIEGGELTGSSGGLMGGLVADYISSSGRSSSFRNIVVNIDLDGCESNVSGTGGVIGRIGDGGGPPGTSPKLKDLRYTGTIDCSGGGNRYTGGIVGKLNHTMLKLENLKFDGTIMGGTYVGGISGYFNGLELMNSSSLGAISTDASGDIAGGLIGFLGSGIVKSNFSMTSIDSIGSITGGFVGDYSGGTISNSWAKAPSVSSGKFWKGTGGACSSTCYYEGTDQSLTSDATYLEAGGLGDPIEAVNLVAGDPWVFDGGLVPKFIWDTNPEFFDD